MFSVRYTPVTLPRDLAEFDLALYQEALGNYTRDVKLAEDDRYEAACRLVDAGLGVLRDADEPGRRSFSAIQLHPLYTETLEREGAALDAGWYVELVVHPRSEYSDNDLLLARFSGASIGLGQQERTGIPGLNIRVPHVSATDFEHDTVQLADFRISYPTLSHMTHNGWVVYHGVIDTYRAYPIGTGPFDSEDDKGECSNERCEPHLFGRYVPDKTPSHAALLGERVELRCRNLVPLNS